MYMFLKLDLDCLVCCVCNINCAIPSQGEVERTNNSTQLGRNLVTPTLVKLATKPKVESMKPMATRSKGTFTILHTHTNI